MIVRNYNLSDYVQLVGLYKRPELYGGQFDENRDSEEKLVKVTDRDPESILVAERGGKIFGSVSLIEDSRVAWLFRFVVMQTDESEEVTRLLFEKASQILKARGHNQVLVYAPVGDQEFVHRYQNLLGFEKGSDYACFYKNI